MSVIKKILLLPLLIRNIIVASLLLAIPLLLGVAQWVYAPSISYLGFNASSYDLIKEMEFTAPQDVPLLLGSDTLGARSADIKHLRIGYDGNRFRLENISNRKWVLLSWTKDEQRYKKRIREWSLQAGDRFQLGSGILKVVSLQEDGHLELALQANAGSKAFHYILEQNELHAKEEEPQRLRCRQGSTHYAKYYLNKKVRGASNYLGGQVFCEDVIPLPGVPYRAFVIRYENGQYYLRPRYVNVLNHVVAKKIGSKRASLFENQMFFNMGDVVTITLGYSTYLLRFEKDDAGAKLSFRLIGGRGMKVFDISSTDVHSYNILRDGAWGLFLGVLAAVLMVLGHIQAKEVLKKKNAVPWASLFLSATALAPLFWLYLESNPQKIWGAEAQSEKYVSYSLYAAYFMVMAVSSGIFLAIKRYYALFFLFFSTTLLTCFGLFFSWQLQASAITSKYLFDFGEQLFFIVVGYHLWSQIFHHPKFIQELWLAYQWLVKKLYTRFERLSEWQMDLEDKIKDFYYRIQDISFFESPMGRWALISSRALLFLGLFIALVSFYALFATETGIAGLQPMELFKLLLCISLAVAFVKNYSQFTVEKGKFGAGKYRQQAKNGAISFLVFFGFICALALVSNDISYFIIVGFASSFGLVGGLVLRWFGYRLNDNHVSFLSWLVTLSVLVFVPVLGYLFFYLFFNHSSSVLIVIGLLLPIMAAAFVLLRQVIKGFTWVVWLSVIILFILFSASIYKFIPNIAGEDNFLVPDNYSSRIETWRNPELYPHSGFQYRYALCLLTNKNLLTGQECEKDYAKLPNVDDDFALTGLLSLNKNKHLISLLIVQLMWLFSFLILVFFMMARITGEPDKERTKLSVFAIVYILSGVGILEAHMMTSWGTNVGLLPVMGQPATLIGRQGSHLLLFLFPFLMGISYLYHRAINTDPS